MVDGLVGPRTIAAVNAVEPGRMLEALKDAQATRYQAIVAADPSQAKWLRGWLIRARWPDVIAEGLA